MGQSSPSGQLMTPSNSLQAASEASQDTGMIQRVHIRQATFILTGAFVVSRVFGLVRTLLFAFVFGAGATSDAYIQAFYIPDFIFNIVAGGALTSAFIPVFTKYMVGDNDEKTAWHGASADRYHLCRTNHTTLQPETGTYEPAGLCRTHQLDYFACPHHAVASNYPRWRRHRHFRIKCASEFSLTRDRQCALQCRHYHWTSARCLPGILRAAQRYHRCLRSNLGRRPGRSLAGCCPGSWPRQSWYAL